MKKPLNLWPYAVPIFLASFAAVVVISGILISRVHYDLVRPDYYDHEIAYEGHLNDLRRTAALPEQPMMQIDAAKNLVAVQFPPSMLEQIETLTLTMYCPADKDQDQQLKLQLDDRGQQTVQLPNAARGNWKASLVWSMNGETYLQEKRITL